MAKKNALIATVYDDVANALTFTVGTAGTITLALGELPAEITSRAMLHGLVQKVSDAAAIPKADLPGDEDEAAKAKFEAMKAVADRLRDGDWKARNGEGAGPVAGIIYRAFAAYVADVANGKKKPVPSDDEVRAVYDAMSRSDQLALRNVPEIAAHIERIKSERGGDATKAVDTGSLLKGLGI